MTYLEVLLFSRELRFIIMWGNYYLKELSIVPKNLET